VESLRDFLGSLGTDEAIEKALESFANISSHLISGYFSAAVVEEKYL
jgi:hypothetical protein